MDEPLSNLDAALRISMRAEIKDLHKSMDTTFVYVTHDQAAALTLADRIVVMREGVVQQIGTPDEIYERPRNTFVASFLGNPPINYLQGVIEVSGAAVAFRRGEVVIPFPAATAAKLAGEAGREVTLGIRSEDVDERRDHEGAALLRGHVRSVLPIGSDQYLGLRVEGVDVFFRVGKEIHHEDDEDVTLAINNRRLHVFDRRSGDTLLWN
jgi:multiple sugar transport system ATP-binding protein